MCLSPLQDTTVYISNHQAPQERATMMKATSNRRPRVSFCETYTVEFVERHTALTSSERDAYWYTSNEIEAFHSEARSDGRILRQSAGLLPTVGPTRGLELRRSAARQKRKIMTLQCVVMAAKKIKDPLRLASIYSRCNEWATRAACAEAQRDIIRAYADDRIIDVESLLPGLPPMTPFPLPLKSAAPKPPTMRKRSCCSQPENCNTERCVRRRTSCC